MGEYAADIDMETGAIRYYETLAEAGKAVFSNGQKAGKFAVSLIDEWIKTLSPEEQKIFLSLLK